MATVVILTLVFSLVEGAFILPAHVGHSKALSRTAKPNGIERGLQNFMNWMRNRIYAPVLRFSMKNGWITASIIIGIFLITVPGLIGGGFVKTTSSKAITLPSI
jgi:multidrug efflux pump subunit AcrB